MQSIHLYSGLAVLSVNYACVHATFSWKKELNENSTAAYLGEVGIISHTNRHDARFGKIAR